MTTVIMRPLTDEAVPALYQALVVEGQARLWRTRGMMVSTQEFASLLTEPSTFPLVGHDPATGLPVILCSCYGYDPLSRSAAVCFGGDLSHPRSLPIVGAAVEAYFDYLFRTVGLRKVAIELPSVHADRLRVTLARFESLVHLEGIRIAHVRFGDELADIHLYGVFQSEWMPFADERARTAVGSESTTALGADRYGEVKAAILEIAGEYLDESAIVGAAELQGDLGFDSLMIAELLIQLDPTGSGLADPQAECRTVQDLVELVSGVGVADIPGLISSE